MSKISELFTGSYNSDFTGWFVSMMFWMADYVWSSDQAYLLTHTICLDYMEQEMYHGFSPFRLYILGDWPFGKTQGQGEKHGKVADIFLSAVPL